ncbi:hypothetical protein BKA70DRAFT_1103479, partial [Coprinopsis sp. MPI-PUGE-AT-0042]
TRQGLPTAMLYGGISLLTTLPAPMVHPFPMVTPGRIIAPAPIQQSSPMTIGFANSFNALRELMLVSCVAVRTLTPGPNIVRAPIVTRAQSRMTQL